MASPRKVSFQELSKHASKDDLWLAIDGNVYDMTQYLSGHPGGLAMLKQAGKDATSNFKLVSAHCTVTKYIEDVLDRRFVGELNKEH
ncbi:hypothetical protein LSH36_137g06109 [Paralvinella palmiformis]|uniref:Cytochrome b5 heme-binding domain-containing protein n=1 Tax=Paralvinella palmiformis TaxID=53620 RepID=A0AAD9JVY6_9ANNE|nr:hypothetical protein LSH36_137g06109 [Paralvinella palmiformis]